VVELERSAEGGAQIVIWPHSALDWAGMRLLLCTLTAAIAAVAIFFALQGAWLVLPFAGLEALLVCGAIYCSARRAVTREVIALAGADLTVGRGRRELVEVGRLPRHWARVVLIADPRGWHPSRLVLSCHGRRIEVGAALTDADRAQLAETLRDRLGPWPAGRFPEPTPCLARAGTPAYE